MKTTPKTASKTTTKTPKVFTSSTAKSGKSALAAIAKSVTEKTTPPPPPVITTGNISATPAHLIHISKLNTRQPTLAEVTASGLLESMRLQGQLTPGIGRPHPTKGKGHIELASGARRSVAAAALGVLYQVIVRPMTDKELLDVILTENLQREDPDPEQEATLIGLRLKGGMEPAEIAAKYGKPELWVKRRMKLLAIVPSLRKLMEPGKPLAHYSTAMKERIGALDPEVQKSLDKGNLAWNLHQSKSVEDLTQTLIRGSKNLSGAAAWMKDPDTFIPGCGPGCATDTKASLFPEDGHECGSCTNAACFNKREALAIDKAINASRAGVPLTDMVLFNSKSYQSCNFEGKQLKLLDRHDFDANWQILTVHTGQYALDLANPLKPKRLSCKRKASSKAGSTTSGVKESREDRLTSKRLATINIQLDTAIEYSERPSSPPILHIVAAFGIDAKRSFCANEKNHAAPWDSLKSTNRVDAISHAYEYSHLADDDDDYGDDDYGDDDPADLSASSASAPAEKFTAGSRETVLWHHIKPILKSRLKVRKNNELLPAWMRQEMRNIADLINFDYDKAWTHICTTQCPPPKSWGPGVDPLTLVQTKPAKFVPPRR